MTPLSNQIKIIGFTGPAGAGKGECIKYISEQLLSKGWTLFFHSLSDELREEAKKNNQIIERSILREIANQLREMYGNGILSIRISKKIQSEIETTTAEKSIYLVDSIRNSQEIVELRKIFGLKFILMGVTAPIDTLVNRIHDRKRYDENAKALSMTEYTKDMLSRELGENEPMFGHNISECLEISDFLIVNDSDISLLHKKLTEFIQQFICNDK